MSARSDSARHLTVPVHHVDDLCVVAPSPDLNEKMKELFERLRKRAPGLLSSQLIRGGPPQHVGLNDGLIYPGTYFPTGTTAAVAQRLGRRFITVDREVSAITVCGKRLTSQGHALAASGTPPPPLEIQR